MAFGNLGTIWAEIGLETKKLQMGVSTAKMQLSALDRQALTQTASINAKLNNIGSGLQTVGKKMSMYVTLPILAVGAASVKAGMDFDSGMTKSLAIMNNITPQIRRQMELTAKSIVDYTTFSAKEGADAYFYLASAGLDAAQSIEALPRVAKFAQAGQFDLALATDLLTDAQSALGLTIRDDVVKNMENMTKVSDVLVKANTLSNATVQQFSESLTNKAGAAMKMLNMDIEEGVAILAAWADQGVKGSEAGNYLNIVLRDLQRSAIENEEVFDQFNISVFDSSGNVRNMADIIGDLEVALDGMSDKEKRATLMMLGFQDRSISAMMSLLGTSDAIRGYEKELRSATGFTENVAAKQMESFTAQVEQLKNQLINVGISIFDILRPRLESLIEWIKKTIDWFDNLTDTQKNLIVNFGIFAAAIGPVAYALSGLTKIIVGLRTVVVGLTVANRGLMASMTLYTLLAAAILGIGQAGDWAADKINNYYLASLARAALPHAGFIHQTKSMIEVIKGLQDNTLTWSEFIRMNGRELDEWAQKHRGATEAIEEATEFVWKYSGAITQSAVSSIQAKIAHIDNEQVLQNLMEQYNLTREGAIEYAKAEGLLEDETEDTTKSIEELEEALDNLNNALESGAVSPAEYIEQLSKLGLTLNQVEDGFNAIIEAAFRFYNNQYALEESTKEYNEELKKLEKMQGTYSKTIGGTAEDILANINAQEKRTEANENYQKVISDGTSTEKQILEATIAKTNADKEAEKTAKNAIATTKTYTATQEELADQVKKVTDKYMESLNWGMLIYNQNQKDIELGKLTAEQRIAAIEQNKILQKEFIESGLKAVELETTSLESFLAMATGFGLTGQDIIRIAEDTGIEIKKYFQEAADSGINNFIELAKSFGLKGQEIIDFAGEMGIEIDTATRERILDINADTIDVDKAIKDVTEKADKLDGKVVTITFKGKQIGMMGAYSMGGIVKAYSSGGIIGNDGARQPILTAAYGMITPQTGREIPIIAHENEVIANTSQQKNVANWFWDFINNPPGVSGGNQEITLHSVINLDGRVAYENWEKYHIGEVQSKQRGQGIR